MWTLLYLKGMPADCGWYLAERLERLTANAEDATVLGSITASSGKMEFEGRQIKQCWIQYVEEKKIIIWMGRSPNVFPAPEVPFLAEK
jgi:hypothetical protein